MDLKFMFIPQAWLEYSRATALVWLAGMDEYPFNYHSAAWESYGMPQCGGSCLPMPEEGAL